MNKDIFCPVCTIVNPTAVRLVPIVTKMSMFRYVKCGIICKITPIELQPDLWVLRFTEDDLHYFFGTSSDDMFETWSKWEEVKVFREEIRETQYILPARATPGGGLGPHRRNQNRFGHKQMCFSSVGTIKDKPNSQKNSPKTNDGWILLDDDTKSK